MPPQEAALRLFGVEIHDLEPDLCLLLTPGGGELHVAVPGAELRGWAQRCDGTRGRAGLLAGMHPDYVEILEALLADGCLRPAGTAAADTARLAATTVVVTGSTALTAPLARMLGAAGFAGVETVDDLVDLSGYDECTVVVAAYERPAHTELTILDDLCAAHGLRFLPFRCELGHGIVGPAAAPGACVAVADALARRLTAAADPRVIDAVRYAAPPDCRRFGPGETHWLLANLAVHLERWVRDAEPPADAAWALEIELDPVALTRVERPVLPMPYRPGPVLTDAPARPELLVDDRTGIVTGVRELAPAPGMPARLKVCAVDVADLRRVVDWPNDLQAFGTSWHDVEPARASAVGEAVERYCGARLAPGRELRHGSFRQLTRAGVPALDPRRLHLYSPRQYASSGFPFAPLTPESEVDWVEGRSVSADEPVWVPACLVAHDRGGGPRYADPLIAGLAGGTSAEHAVTSGLEEVLERDTTMVWWANTPRLPRLPVPGEISALIADTRDTYDVTLLPIGNEFDVPVLAAAVTDRATGWLSIGFAARHDPLEAAKKALAEGFTLQHTCQALDDEYELAGLVGALPHLGNLKPHRADRRYLDSYRPDFGDVYDLLCQQQVYLDRRAGEHVAPWVRDLPVRSWEGLPALGERRLKAYQERVEARGFEIITVDLTTCDVAAAGFHAAHTLVPGLVSNFPAGLPFWGGGRISAAAVGLGWRRDPLPESGLNVFPLPHA